MSILDHNTQYDIKKVQPDDDDNAFGKCFWFSGSMRKQKKKHLMAKEENLIQASVTPVQLKSIPSDDVNDISQIGDEPIEDHSTKNGGTFFKLNGSFELDNSDLSDDSEEVKITQQQHHKAEEEGEVKANDDNEEEDGGTWFGVSGRHLRAESMANLLMLMDAYQPSQPFNDDEPTIVAEAFNEVMEENNCYLDDLDKQKSTIPILSHKTESVKDSLMEPDDTEILEDSSINEKLLQDFDAQFFEIEKMAMESFDDFDLTTLSEETTKAPKKNQLFGIKSIDDNRKLVSNTKSFDNSIKPKRDRKSVV